MAYKEELKKDLMELMQRFGQEEGNNRLTTFNMIGLVTNMNAFFEKNKVDPKRKDETP